MVPASTGCLSQRQQGYVGQLGTAQHGARWQRSLGDRRGDPATVLMPSWTPQDPVWGCCQQLAQFSAVFPQLALPWSRPGPAPLLALSSMPALLWMLSTSPASSRAKEPKASQEQPQHSPLCPAPHKGCISP